MGRYYVHAADFCYKLPANMSLEEGALMEPLAVGVHACRSRHATVDRRLLGATVCRSKVTWKLKTTLRTFHGLYKTLGPMLVHFPHTIRHFKGLG